ncbi:MAG: hypothetical protein F6K54_36310 [Okeania sp. SIO3B5]|uniref:hypothetical protein n=1 Tax=Okeania sp. SIO3B5 TaxID=2607811 RepID=UPI001401131E|nr:hypothetical protein [Okeania sp. SIO3B5]NEO58043.1 hypothetical protein [Okeania sp. SIO3B5]
MIEKIAGKIVDRDFSAIPPVFYAKFLRVFNIKPGTFFALLKAESFICQYFDI